MGKWDRQDGGNSSGRRRSIRKNSIILAAAAGCLASMVIVGCNVTDPPPFNLRKAGDGERMSETYPEAQAMRPLPTTLESEFMPPNPDGTPARQPATRPTTGPALDVNPIVRMTLQEIVQPRRREQLGRQSRGLPAGDR